MSEIIFEYEALTNSGETIKGIFKGKKVDFERVIQQKNLTLLKIKEKKEKLDNTKFNSNDMLSLIEELHYLIKSGMPIEKSIKLLLKTTKKQVTINILKSILFDLKSGLQFSIALKNAFKKEGIDIDSLSISFLSTAEEVGDISDGLLQLFEHLTFEKKIRSQIRQAMSYPLFLMGMSVVVAFLIFFLIIPRFAVIFSPEEFEKLPPLSHAVLSTGMYLNNHMIEFFIALFVVIFFIISIFKFMKISWISFMYHLPKVSDIVLDLQLTIIYNSLSTMLVGGLELDKALRQIQKIKLLPDLNELLKNTIFEIRRGQKLSTVFSVSKVIPSSDIALISVGESSATLDKVFKSLANRHSEAFSENVKKLLSLLEPTVIVALGIFISVIVVSIMMAVMSLTDVVG